MQMRVTEPPSRPILQHAGHSSPAHAKAPAPVLSIFAYSNEGLHANEDDLFLLARAPLSSALPLYNCTLTGGEWRAAAVMAIRATG